MHCSSLTDRMRFTFAISDSRALSLSDQSINIGFMKAGTELLLLSVKTLDTRRGPAVKAKWDDKNAS